MSVALFERGEESEQRHILFWRGPCRGRTPKFFLYLLVSSNNNFAIGGIYHQAVSIAN